MISQDQKPHGNTILVKKKKKKYKRFCFVEVKNGIYLCFFNINIKQNLSYIERNILWLRKNDQQTWQLTTITIMLRNNCSSSNVFCFS